MNGIERTTHKPSNPTYMAVRAEKQAYTPGQMRKAFPSSMMRHSFVAASTLANATSEVLETFIVGEAGRGTVEWSHQQVRVGVTEIIS